MKKLSLAIGLAMSSVIGWGQEIILFSEDFNYPSLVNTIDYGCGNLISPGNIGSGLYQPYNNTYYFHTPNSGGCPIYLGMFGNEFVNYQISFAHRRGSSSSIYWVAQYSVDSLEWYDVSSIIFTNSEWQLDSITFNFPNFIEEFHLRLNNYGAHIFIDEITLKGNPGEPEEPLTCDTIYIEQPPIIIYETDIPQECLLDGNGDGMIGLNDLLNLLQWYGSYSECTIIN